MHYFCLTEEYQDEPLFDIIIACHYCLSYENSCQSIRTYATLAKCPCDISQLVPGWLSGNHVYPNSSVNRKPLVFLCSEMGQTIQKLCVFVVSTYDDVLHPLRAVPLIHFLTSQSQPFDKLALARDKPKQDLVEWWGAEGFELASLRKKSFDRERSVLTVDRFCVRQFR